uniref:hypothetical protein n=1 Tax=Mycobacteroides abscessus TaxID=36809 RepID=UPI0013E3477F|nr:hypothetical protein [Mycobacteroides abscessus]
MSAPGAAGVPKVLLLAAIVLLVLTGCARTVEGTASVAPALSIRNNAAAARDE